MSNRIKILDPITANQIAAGEVVERPASVVKELLENSVDAGASKIEVEIIAAGVELIRITDNGSGMEREDAALAFQRHATSKLSSSADLAAISTLGFRGEALPSIASVSNMEVITREPHAMEGTRLLLEGGKLKEVQDTGCPVGTTIIVKDLFFNTPARLKFLKSAATETGQISDVINRLAMAYPNISVKFVNHGRVLLHTSGNGNLVESVSQVYGKDLARDMIPVEVQDEKFFLTGLLGRPHQTRSSRNQQTFFVNGRFIRSKALTQAVAEGYHTLIANNRYPLVVLSLQLQPNLVDVNVHPTKLEVRFAKEAELIEFVAAAIRKTLTSKLLIPGIETKNTSTNSLQSNLSASVDDPSNKLSRQIDDQQFSQATIFTKEIKHPALGVGSKLSINQAGAPGQVANAGEERKAFQQVSTFKQVFDSEGDLPSNHDLRSTQEASLRQEAEATSLQKNPLTGQELPLKQESPDRQELGFKRELAYQEELPSASVSVQLANLVKVQSAVDNEPESYLSAPNQRDSINAVAEDRVVVDSKLPDLQPLGQIELTYIIAKGPEGLYIIDQHAAHERLNYEEIWGRFKRGQLESQVLLTPITLELTNQEMEVLVENILQLSDLGVLLEHFGGNTFLLRGYPTVLDNPQTLIRDLLELLSNREQRIDSRKLREEVIYMIACKSSVKANQRLNLTEMEHLIWRLGRAENPFSCPHGRPTIIAITGKELAKRFQRV